MERQSIGSRVRDLTGRLVVSKEVAREVASALWCLAQKGEVISLDEQRTLTGWLFAVAKRLPSAAAIERDRERRKAKG